MKINTPKLPDSLSQVEFNDVFDVENPFIENALIDRVRSKLGLEPRQVKSSISLKKHALKDIFLLNLSFGD